MTFSNVEFSIKVDGKECFRYSHGWSNEPIKIRIEPNTKTLWVFTPYRRYHYFLEPIDRKMEPWT